MKKSQDQRVDTLAIFHVFGDPIDEKIAIHTIDQFREKYHGGPPELSLLSIFRNLKRLDDIFTDSVDRLIPKDILEFRIKEYKGQFDRVIYEYKLEGPQLVHSVIGLEQTEKVDKKILNSDSFMSHDELFLSVFSTGKALYKVKSDVIKQFILENIDDYSTLPIYVFPEDMQWALKWEAEYGFHFAMGN